MTKYDPEREANIAKAIRYLKTNLGVKKSAVARMFLVPYCQFKAHLEGQPVQNSKGGHN